MLRHRAARRVDFGCGVGGTDVFFRPTLQKMCLESFERRGRMEKQASNANCCYNRAKMKREGPHYSATDKNKDKAFFFLLPRKI